MICPSDGQSLASLLAAQGLATLRACLVFPATIKLIMLFLKMVCLTVNLHNKARGVWYGVSKGGRKTATDHPPGGYP